MEARKVPACYLPATDLGLDNIRAGRAVFRVVPWQPAIGALRDIRRVELQLIQIVKRVDSVQLASEEAGQVQFRRLSEQDR